MCGIFGIWNREGSPVDLRAVVRGTTALKHRGPDDEGYILVNTRSGRVQPCGGIDSSADLRLPLIQSFAGDDFDLAFGFRRLSILDLSPAGHQPMASHDGRCWIVFNGEIYNYRELRDELRSCGHEFRTATDTEVILAAYAEWGRECVDRFNGMWAFALWDGRCGELFISRDRFGIKPLHYATPGATFAFASEQKAFVVSGLMPFSPRVDSLVEFIALGRMTSPRGGETFINGIHSVPPAHRAVITREGMGILQYWSPPEPKGGLVNEHDLISEYRELFDSAVKLHLRADVPTGTALSGGLDSSSIVATANRLLELARSGTGLEGLTQETFSSVYADDGVWNERKHIESVVRHTGVHSNFVFPSGDGLWSELDDVMWHHDEPVITTGAFAEWCVMRLVRDRGIVVILNGQGADEIFGGYTPIFNAAVRQDVGRGALGNAWRNAKFVDNGSVDRGRFVAGEAFKMLVRRVLPGVPQHVYESRTNQALNGTALHPDVVRTYLTRKGIGLAPRPHATVREQTLEWFNEYPLSHNLQWSDRNSMAFSVESRVPFLDYRLVEFVFGRASDLSLRNGWTKWIHRESMEGRLPDSITWRRDKVGFATPEVRWVMDSSARMQRHFSSPSPIEREFFDWEAINREITTLRPETAPLLWRYAAATSWMRRFAAEGAKSKGVSQ